MSRVLTCDECGEAIAEGEDYYSAQLVLIPGRPDPDQPPTAQSPPVQVDWHVAHAPGPIQHVMGGSGG